MVEEAAMLGRRFKPDMVIAIGGGSVLDMGKAVAAIIPNQGNVYDYVEVVGRSVPLKAKPLPFIAIPTTASSGSEVTRNAVLKSAQDRVKISLRSPEMLADVAIIDPTLTYGTDPVTSGRGAMDAFTHLMEAYVCGEPNPLTDMICEEGLRRLSRAMIAGCLRDDKKHAVISPSLPCWGNGDNQCQIRGRPWTGFCTGRQIGCATQCDYRATCADCDARKY